MPRHDTGSGSSKASHLLCTLRMERPRCAYTSQLPPHPFFFLSFFFPSFILDRATLIVLRKLQRDGYFRLRPHTIRIRGRMVLMRLILALKRHSV